MLLYCVGGFIEIATDIDRLEEYRRIAAFNRKCGVNVMEISPKEVQSLFPLCAVDDILAGRCRVNLFIDFIHSFIYFLEEFVNTYLLVVLFIS